MQVDQPLCYDCIRRVELEVEDSIRDAKQECAAYEAALARLRKNDTQPYSDKVCCACTTDAAFAVMFALTWSYLTCVVCCPYLHSQRCLSNNDGIAGCSNWLAVTYSTLLLAKTNCPIQQLH